MIQVYHNPQCSKSRECLAILDGSAQEYEVVKYLNQTPDEQELKTLIKKLGIKPIELVRTKEALWKEKFETRKMTNAQIIKAMVKHPILMERPIVINGDKAIIGRPVERILDIIR
ncbi:arsenate reductase (glutaredoxin) [Flavobacterium pallidum]|uniref:Arsenate reductase (Glutaredoxin) n=1 Tax=Flavobacterium pallidum TaxID=2172098 RepID=A0A2S1SF91_9FLAO|nr:arsenate reductase (glutaredoxin) [Flavobacterium pallidum]AWI25031.1 arsenate reductase (glutaredoxin) [Flavobacterium pallidum]